MVSGSLISATSSSFRSSWEASDAEGAEALPCLNPRSHLRCPDRLHRRGHLFFPARLRLRAAPDNRCHRRDPRELRRWVLLPGHRGCLLEWRVLPLGPPCLPVRWPSLLGLRGPLVLLFWGLPCLVKARRDSSLAPRPLPHLGSSCPRLVLGRRWEFRSGLRCTLRRRSCPPQSQSRLRRSRRLSVTNEWTVSDFHHKLLYLAPSTKDSFWKCGISF